MGFISAVVAAAVSAFMEVAAGTWNQETVHVERIALPAEFAEFAALPAGAREDLKWYFFASRDWTAFERGGACIVEESEWSFPDTRVEIRLSPVLYGSERDFVREAALARAGEDAVDLPVWTDSRDRMFSGGADIRRSELYVALGGPDDPLTVIRICESSADATRPGTKAVLERLAGILARVRSGRGALEAALEADGSMIRSDAGGPVEGVRLVENAWDQHDIEGYVNAGVEGYLQAEIDGQSRLRSDAQARRWVGWDPDPAKKYYFRLPVDDWQRGDGSERDTTYRLRFHPCNVLTLYETNTPVRTHPAGR